MSKAHVSASNPPRGRLVSNHVDVWMNATCRSTQDEAQYGPAMGGAKRQEKYTRRDL
jgi:hypothetical protein